MVFADPIRPIRHHKLATCLVIVSLGHLLVLYFVTFARPKPIGDPPMTVTLRPVAATDKPVAEAPVPATVAREADNSESTAGNAVEAEGKPGLIPERTQEEGRSVASPRGVVLYQRALESVRRQPIEDKQEPRTFSTADFPRGERQADPWAPPTHIRRYAQRPETLTYNGLDGMAVRRSVDAFGNVTCRKLIDVPGDGFPPMWHVFPRGTNC